MKIFCLFILYILTTIEVFYCQTPENINEIGPYQLLRFAKSYERIHDQLTAIEYYKKYLTYKPDNPKANYAIANLYRETRNFQRAADYYIKTYNLNKKKYFLGLFYYALMLQMKSECDSAVYYFENFIAEHKNNKKSELYVYWAGNNIEGCEQAKRKSPNTSDILINNLGKSVNKPHVEFAPYQLNDSTLIYSSLRIDTMIYYSIDNHQQIPARQIYFALKKDSSWLFKDKWGKVFNIDTVDTGNGIFSSDKKRFYFTRCFKNRQNKTVCHIYVSTFENGDWTKPKPLYKKINMPDYTSTQPTLGTTYDKTQEVLYFVSDRPGGYGGLDIWYSVYDTKNKIYKKPLNASGFINTPGNEITPEYHIPTKTMYFSSDFWPGNGGYDIFKTRGELVNWLPVKNAGMINSAADDLYYKPNHDNTEGFFVSNRQGTSRFNNEICCDDLYSFKVFDKKQIIIKGTLYNDKNNLINEMLSADQKKDSLSITANLALDKAIVSLYLYYNNKKSLYLINNDTTDQKGNFRFIAEPDNYYKITVSDERYIGKSVEFSTWNLSSSKVVELKPIAANKIAKEQSFTLKNIYYAFGKSNLSDEAKAIIDSTIYKILIDFPDIQIEISSHTDNIGDEKFNLDLSQKRAESVVNYLTDKDINPSRIIAKGYGKSQPVAPNTTPEGKDNPEGRDKNRRTEFKILGKLKP